MRSIATLFVFYLLVVRNPFVTLGQNVTPSAATPPASHEELISLQFPPNLELKVLIEYVGMRLGINFIYDEQTVAQRITILSPVKISKESLLGLLESALRMKGLVVVSGDQPGWKKILPSEGLALAALPTTQPAMAGASPAAAVTQVFVLQFADPRRTDTVIRPFLTQPGGNSIALSEQHLLIVSDYASTIERVAAMVHLVDKPPPDVATRFVQLKNLDVASLTPELQQILTAREKAQAQQQGLVTTPQQSVEIVQDARSNDIILIGSPDKVAAAEAITSSLDVSLALETKVYALRTVSPDRLDNLVRELIDPLDIKRLYQSAADRDASLLVVTTTPAIHRKIATLRDQIDVQVAHAASPIHFYKLTNSTAADVLATIRSLEASNGNQNAARTEPGDALPTQTENQTPGFAPALPSQNQSTANPVYHDNVAPPGAPAYGGGTGLSFPGNSSSGSNLPNNPEANNSNPSAPTQPVIGIHTAKATITADPNTNTIIVEADPTMQKIYGDLIRTLDKRRPQVLIECTLVTVDTTQSFSLGVELGGSTNGTPKVITFNSFGLSTPSASTGVLTLTPGAGFNGTLLGSSAAQVVIQALATSGRAKVLSVPRILVNDNATGTLQSVQEQPFTSVNASTTVATTSFAGYADAGTTITLTPHISEGDHLQLEYTVSLNNFTGSSSNGIPPPRQTDSVQSKITVPDDSTVVVGGLSSSNFSDTRQTIPILGDIPLLKELVSQQTHDSGHSTLFVFIRPVILRDDQFQDLKYFSQRDKDAAGIPEDYPQSAPLLIR